MRAIQSECGRRILITDEQDDFILLEIREVDSPVGDVPETMRFCITVRQNPRANDVPSPYASTDLVLSVDRCETVRRREEAPYQQFRWIADGVGDACGLITGDLCNLLRALKEGMPPKVAGAFERVLAWVDSRIKE